MQIWEVPSLWRTECEPRLMQNEAEFLIFNLLSKEYACVNKTENLKRNDGLNNA